MGRDPGRGPFLDPKNKEEKIKTKTLPFFFCLGRVRFWYWNLGRQEKSWKTSGLGYAKSTPNTHLNWTRPTTGAGAVHRKLMGVCLWVLSEWVIASLGLLQVNVVIPCVVASHVPTIWLFDTPCNKSPSNVWVTLFDDIIVTVNVENESGWNMWFDFSICKKGYDHWW